MLNDLEVVFCLDDLLLHIVLLDHLLTGKLLPDHVGLLMLGEHEGP